MIESSMKFALFPVILIFISVALIIYWLTSKGSREFQFNDHEDSEYHQIHSAVHSNVVSSTKSVIFISFFILAGLLITVGLFLFLGVRQMRPIAVQPRTQEVMKTEEPAAIRQPQLSETTIFSYINDFRHKIQVVDAELIILKKIQTQNNVELETLKKQHGNDHQDVKTKATLINSDIQKIALLETQKAELLLSLEEWNKKLQTLVESKKMQQELKASIEPVKEPEVHSAKIDQPATSDNNSPVWITGKNLGTNEFLITSKQFATYTEAVNHAYQELSSITKANYMKKNRYMTPVGHTLLADKEFLKDSFIINEHHAEKTVDLGNGLNQPMHQVYILAMINDTKLEEVVNLSMQSQINERAYFIQASIAVITVLFGVAGFWIKK